MIENLILQEVAPPPKSRPWNQPKNGEAQILKSDDLTNQRNQNVAKNSQHQKQNNQNLANPPKVLCIETAAKYGREVEKKEFFSCCKIWPLLSVCTCWKLDTRH